MTISNTKAKSVYETNGERREWEIGFDFDSNVSKLNIILEDSEGYQTIVEDNYLIEDGVVVYPSLESELDPIEEGYKIILFRYTPNTQEIDLRDNVTEKGLDKLTLQVQELSEQIDRAVKVPLVEEGVNEYQDLVLKVREERDSALEQIKEATSVVSDYTQSSALNAVTSKEEADRAVEASNVSVMASADAEAFATRAENLANEAHNAVSAYVNGLGAMRNAVLDLGVFEDNQRRASSSIIDFDFEPLDVFIRFTDSSKNMWINGAHSFAGIEKVGDKKYKIFYSVSPEDFASQSAIKGPFYVQYVIKYSIFSGKPVIYRGRVDTVDQLPETAEDGDLWYVGPVEQSNKEEYIWQNGKWELLGSTDFTNIYTKEEIDNKVIVIEADIDANADAILKTRGDFMESDSELQQQINAHAEELTTQRNDIDGLGDQVAGIEGKIPETATDANPLVTKQDLLDAEMDIRDDVDTKDGELQEQLNAQATAIAGKQDALTAGKGISIDGNVISATGGGGEVPDNVYTEDNLVAGENITFSEVLPEGGIDEHTVACWHFEGNLKDEVSGLSFYAGETFSSDYGKEGFGQCLNWIYNGSTTVTDFAPGTGDYTVDAWIKKRDSSNYFSWYVNNQYHFYATGTSVYVLDSDTGSPVSETYELVNDVWYHYAIQRKNGILQFFYNGKKIYEVTDISDITTFFINSNTSQQSYLCHDEVRVSKVARYDGDFTPPTEPYTLATGPTKKAINAIIPPVELPSDLYRQSNLLGGNNIEIVPEPVEGGIDEHTLACWNFDKDTKDEVNGLVFESYTDYAKVSTDYQCLGTGVGNLYHSSGTWTFDVGATADWTIEGFFMLPDTNGCYLGRGDYYSTSERLSQYYLRFDTNKIRIYDFQTELAVYEKDFGTYNWVHLALQSKSGKIQAFCDGAKVMEIDAPSGGFSGGKFAVTSRYLGRFYADAVRISNVARYTEDFTPPTQPYRKAEPTGNMVINFTGETGGSNASFPLFYHTFADHILNDASWLRADTFSWQSGDMYVSAYNHLVADLEGITAEVESIGSTEITFYRATDGHKIVLADQEDNVSAIYRATGVAWYYILDTENKRFKLPRTKHAFAGIRTGVGNFVEAGLPNITGGVRVGGYKQDSTSSYSDGALSYSGMGSTTGDFYGNTGNGFSHVDVALNASNSNPIYGNSDTVQPNATEQYLYFYVGNTVRNQTEVDVGTVTEQLNGKQDVLGNNVDYVVESYNDGTNWYRVYKSGWLEQGGKYDNGAAARTILLDVTFLKPFSNANYFYNFHSIRENSGNRVGSFGSALAQSTSISSIFFGASETDVARYLVWYACGQGA